MSEILAPTIDNIRVEDHVVAETKERVFARLCQLLSQHDSEIKISFDDYDRIDESDDVRKFVSSMPEFFDAELISNMRACSVIERYLDVDVNNVDDFIGGVVNPALLVGKSLKCFEDSKAEEVVFRLISN